MNESERDELATAMATIANLTVELAHARAEIEGLRECHETSFGEGWDASRVFHEPIGGNWILGALERSSLGTPEAKAARESVSDERAAEIVARSKRLAGCQEFIDSPDGDSDVCLMCYSLRSEHPASPSECTSCDGPHKPQPRRP